LATAVPPSVALVCVGYAFTFTRRLGAAAAGADEALGEAFGLGAGGGGDEATEPAYS